MKNSNSDVLLQALAVINALLIMTILVVMIGGAKWLSLLFGASPPEIEIIRYLWTVLILVVLEGSVFYMTMLYATGGFTYT